MLFVLFFSALSFSADLKRPLLEEPRQLDLFSESTIAKVCAANLTPTPTQISWKGSLNELMANDEGPFFAKLSQQTYREEG
jgi:hypothetical protein